MNRRDGSELTLPPAPSKMNAWGLTSLIVCAGVSILFTYNILLCALDSIVKHAFSKHAEAFGQILFGHQVGNLVVSLAMISVTKPQYLTYCITAGVFCNVVGSLGCMISAAGKVLWVFIAGASIVGIGTGSIQSGLFALATHPLMEEHSTAKYLSMGMGFGGVASFLIGLLFSEVFKDPTGQYMSSRAAICLVGLSTAFTLSSVGFFIWCSKDKMSSSTTPKTLEGLVRCDSRTILEHTPELGGVLSSSKSHPESASEDLPVNGDVIAKVSPATDLEAKKSSGVMKESATDINVTVDCSKDEQKTPFTPTSFIPLAVYAICTYVTYLITFSVFPGVAPVKWVTGRWYIYYIGVFQFSDVAGRFLYSFLPYKLPEIVLVLLTFLRLIIAILCCWAAPKENNVVVRTLLIAMLAMSLTYLFTNCIIHGPSVLPPAIRGTGATILIISLLLGISSGLWLSNHYSESLVSKFA